MRKEFGNRFSIREKLQVSMHFKMTRRLYFIMTLFLGLAACDDSTQKAESTSNTKNRNHFSNIIQVQQFGDTVRIEIEKRGDTIIKHYIDLKGLADDNFDNSYNTVCTYILKPNDTTINSTFCITVNDYWLYFDQRKVNSYCDSIIKTLTSDYDRENIRPYYENLKKRALNKNKTNIIYLNSESELIENFNCKIVNQKTKEKPKSILIEFYKTEFSGGKNYYLISTKGDTLGLFHKMDYIN